MTTFRQLSRPVRAAIVAPWALLLAVCLTAATPSFRALMLDASNHPTRPVDFASANWTGDPTAGKPIAPTSVSTHAVLGTGGLLTVGATGNGTLSLQGGVSYGGGIALYTIDSGSLAYFDGPTGSLALNRAGGGNLTLAGDLTAAGSIYGVTPILPASECAEYLPQFFAPAGNASIVGSAITHVDLSLIVDYAQNCLWLNGVMCNFDANGCALDQSTVDNVLLVFAAYHVSNAYIDLSSGGNATPTGGVQHQDAAVTIQLPAPVPANAGLVYAVTSEGGVTAVNYDATVALAASTLVYGDNSVTVTIGVQDSPSMAAVAAEINTLLSYSVTGNIGGIDDDGGSGATTFDATGAFAGQDTVESDYPFTFAGPAIVSSSPGVVAAVAPSVAALQAAGCNVTTN